MRAPWMGGIHSDRFDLSLHLFENGPPPVMMTWASGESESGAEARNPGLGVFWFSAAGSGSSGLPGGCGLEVAAR